MEQLKEKRIIKTKRDREMINFFDKGMMATADQLNLIFFHSPVSCRRRLVRMYEMGWIERVRADESLPYVYFKTSKKKSPVSYEEQRELTYEQETKQNKQLYLTQCLTELMKIGGHLIEIEVNKTLTTSVTDLMVVVEYGNKNFLFLIDVFAREGNAGRHQAFFNQSKLLESLSETYQLDYILNIIYTPRLINSGRNTIWIERPATLSYRDYKKVDWLKEMKRLKNTINKLL